MKCTECGFHVDIRAAGVAEAVTGWRVQRSGGGANQILDWKGLGQWLCAGCVARRRAGIPIGQGDLF